MFTFFTEHFRMIAYDVPKIGGNTEELMLTFCVCVYFSLFFLSLIFNQWLQRKAQVNEVNFSIAGYVLEDLNNQICRNTF